jgi:hypothetical protein
MHRLNMLSSKAMMQGSLVGLSYLVKQQMLLTI